MSTLSHDVDWRLHVSQPQLSRSRQRYRGPRESQRINLEIQQLTYDIARLRQRTGSQREDFEVGTATLSDGGELVTGVDLPGAENLTVRVLTLLDRVRRLERGEI